MVITAIPAGFAAGLFGIGGGLITVPILFYIFGSAGIEPTYLMLPNNWSWRIENNCRTAYYNQEFRPHIQKKTPFYLYV